MKANAEQDRLNLAGQTEDNTMEIRPVEELKSNLKSVTDYCMEFNQPVFLTENGKGKLVLMSMDQYEHINDQLDLTAALYEAEMQFYDGSKTYTTEEVDRMMREVIDGTAEQAA